MNIISSLEFENGIAHNRLPLDEAMLDSLQTSSVVNNHRAATVFTNGTTDYPPPHVVKRPQEHIYDADAPADTKFAELGYRLRTVGDLYRNPEPRSGLWLATGGTRPQQLAVRTAEDLQAALVDRLRLTVVQNGKPKGGRIPGTELKAMLKAEVFLQQFPPLDRVLTRPLYLPNWSVTAPGYQDGGRTQRYLFAGTPTRCSYDLKTINQFLDVISFASNADRTNAVAMALTVRLRNHWPGQKPWFMIAANKSHAGKGTVAAFATGHDEPTQITYDTTDWAFRSTVVAAFNARPELPTLLIDNVRMDGRDRVVKSAFLEGLLHDPEPRLYAPGLGKPITVPAHFVVAVTANSAVFSEDLHNRGVTIRLELRGDAAQRRSPIGDPKNEFLPANREEIDSELHGMISRWIAKGQPLDETVRHPFKHWAENIGGILLENGFKDFLGNRVERQTTDDPIKHALALLGAEYLSGDAIRDAAQRSRNTGCFDPRPGKQFLS
ncbi:MAG: hypothetical protein EXS09_20710 [Gemmataceae bacterium]|nr:hypothetical protein [Gemmataceae bacterium]